MTHPQKSSILEPFLALARREHYGAKTVIMREGEEPNDLYYILQGSVTVLMEDEDGHEVILAYLGPGEFFGELGLFEPEMRRSAWVFTRTECDIAVAGYASALKLFKEAPQLVAHITGQLCKRLRDTSQKVGQLAFLDVTGRIAKVLLDISHDSQAITHPDGMLIRITREELSRIASCSREVAGRVLRDLEQQGLIQVNGKEIVIFSPK